MSNRKSISNRHTPISSQPWNSASSAVATTPRAGEGTRSSGRKPAPGRQDLPQIQAERLTRSGLNVDTDGERRQFKTYAEPSVQAIGEHLANRIYRDLGIAAPHSDVVHSNGKTLVSTHRTDVLGSVQSQGLAADAATARHFVQGFAADLLLKNADVLGRRGDGVMVTASGGLCRASNGGALLFRTSGRKAKGSLGRLDEIRLFFDGKVNPVYASLLAAGGFRSYRDIPDFAAQVERIVALRDAHQGWARYVKSVLPYFSGPACDLMVKMLDARTQALQQVVEQTSSSAEDDPPIVMDAGAASRIMAASGPSIMRVKKEVGWTEAISVGNRLVHAIGNALGTRSKSARMAKFIDAVVNDEHRMPPHAVKEDPIDQRYTLYSTSLGRAGRTAMLSVKRADGESPIDVSAFAHELAKQPGLVVAVQKLKALDWQLSYGPNDSFNAEARTITINASRPRAALDALYKSLAASDVGAYLPDNPSRLPETSTLSAWDHLEKAKQTWPKNEASRRDRRHLKDYAYDGDAYNDELKAVALQASPGSTPPSTSKSKALAKSLDRVAPGRGYVGMVHKGISGKKNLGTRFKNLEFLAEGASLVNWGFLSTSVLPQVALDFARGSPTAPGVLLNLMTESGISIAQFAGYFAEQAEVLFKPSSPMAIDLRAYDAHRGMVAIVGHELPPDGPAAVGQQPGVPPPHAMRYEQDLAVSRPPTVSEPGQAKGALGRPIESLQSGGGTIREHLTMVLATLSPAEVASLLTQPKFFADGLVPEELSNGLRGLCLPLSLRISEAAFKHFQGVEYRIKECVSDAVDNPVKWLLPIEYAARLVAATLQTMAGGEWEQRRRSDAPFHVTPLQAGALLDAALRQIPDASLQVTANAYMNLELKRISTMEPDGQSRRVHLHRLVSTLQHLASHLQPAQQAAMKPALDHLRQSVLAVSHPSADNGARPDAKGIAALLWHLPCADGTRFEDLQSDIEQAMRPTHGPAGAQRFMDILSPYLARMDQNALSAELSKLAVAFKQRIVDRRLAMLSQATEGHEQERQLVQTLLTQLSLAPEGQQRQQLEALLEELVRPRMYEREMEEVFLLSDSSPFSELVFKTSVRDWEPVGAVPAQSGARSTPSAQRWTRHPVTLPDGSQVEGFLLRVQSGAQTDLYAFRTPDDPLGYHEAQRGAQCGRHTLNMLDPSHPATEAEYRAFLTVTMNQRPPRIAVGDGTHRDATPSEIDGLISVDTGAELATIAEFQAWRRTQPGGAALRVFVSGSGTASGAGLSHQARIDLESSEAFGVGYREGATGADHSLVIRRVDGVFRVYDSRSPNLEALVGASAVEALQDFLTKHAQDDPTFGRSFDYLCEPPAGG